MNKKMQCNRDPTPQKMPVAGLKNSKIYPNYFSFFQCLDMMGAF